MIHGTLAGYKTHGCRCQPCTFANRNYVASQRGTSTTYRHGTLESYLNGCRQPCCARVCQTPEWFDQAACRGMDVDLFYPVRGDNEGSREAKRVCEDCPVRWRCADLAINDVERYGVWGNLTTRQRARIRGNKAKRQEVARKAYLESVGKLAS